MGAVFEVVVAEEEEEQVSVVVAQVRSGVGALMRMPACAARTKGRDKRGEDQRDASHHVPVLHVRAWVESASLDAESGAQSAHV